MSNDKQRSNDQRKPDVRENPLLIKDLAQYLSRVATMMRDPRTGNTELSDGLRDLARALRRNSQRPINEISDIMKDIGPRKRKQSARQPKAVLPSELTTLSIKEVDDILSDSVYTKPQLIELGTKRFGVSKSKLSRLKKDDVRASVRSALNHEKSLDAISREAQRGGQKRSS